MKNLPNKFIIPINNEEEWDKILLILSFYGFTLSCPFNKLISGFPYIRHDGRQSKFLISGSTGFGLKHNQKDHTLVTVKEVLENY